MNGRWFVAVGCGMTLVVLGHARTWGQTRGAEPASVPSDALVIQAEPITSRNGETQVQGNVILSVGSVRFHVPRSAVRIASKGSAAGRDIFVDEPLSPPAHK